MSQSPEFLALDRSMRRMDVDGHLFVEMTNLSKANVCPYYGREIPNGKELGLNPEQVYLLYRDPAELRAAAPTVAGKPLLKHHKPVTSEDHPDELVVGSVGTDIRYEHPYLRGPLSVWRQDAIDAINADPRDPEAPEQQRELSPGYRYRADMTPGTSPEGVAFHGSMRDIKFNHVAIVSEGRTGHDVFVADEAPKGFIVKHFPKIIAALAAILPSMSATQALALDEALAVDAFPKKTAEDEFPDMSADARKDALDKFCAKSGKAMDALSEDEKREAFKAAKDMRPATGSPATGQAADEAFVEARVVAAVTAATKDMVPKAEAAKLAQDAASAASATVHALYAARTAVEPVVGVCALDSAEAVYRFALDHLKADHKDTAAPALPALYEASAKAAAATAIATDAAPTGKFDPKILGLSHIRKG